ncbi:MAG: hypothetical protein ACOZF0_04380 [Thermodesulfobacteriota bacterium]
METTFITQQVVDINRLFLENVWNTLTLLHDQVERTGRAVLDQRNALLEEGSRLVEEWAKESKKNRIAAKKAMDDNFEQILGLFTLPDAEKPKRAKAGN